MLMGPSVWTCDKLLVCIVFKVKKKKTRYKVKIDLSGIQHSY